MKSWLLFLFILLSVAASAQVVSSKQVEDRDEITKPKRNIGVSLGYNPFPQELLLNLEFRASKNLSPFVSTDLGYDELRSEPIESGTNGAGFPIYEPPTIIGDKSYYKITLGTRLTFGEKKGNYDGLILDIGLQTKLGGDQYVDYYSLISRFGYRKFFGERFYFLTCLQFNLAYTEDNWNPTDSQVYLPDFDVDLLHIRVGYQF